MPATPTQPAEPGGMPMPASGDDWLALTEEPLDIDALYRWGVHPSCGAVVMFSGTVRDHAPDRPGVTLLEYEGYESQVVGRLEAIAAEARRRWPELVRLAIIHRLGPVHVEESSVVVVASSPHRDGAFDAGRFLIDALKASVPIWKREHWAGGSDWGLAATDLVEAEQVRPEESRP